MSIAADSTIERLDAVRQQWWLCSLLCGLAAVLACSGIILGVIVAADVLLQLPMAARAVLFVVWMAASLVMILAVVARMLIRQRTLAGAARRIELAFPDLENDVINLVQLAESDAGAPESFRQAAMDEAAVRVSHVTFAEAARQQSRWSRWKMRILTPRDLIEWAAALVLVACILSALQIASPPWAESSQRVLRPWAVSVSSLSADPDQSFNTERGKTT